MTPSIRFAAIMIAASAAAYGVSVRQTSREAAAVRAARAAQNTALAARDLDRVAAYWTDDVVIRSGLGRVVQGRAAYRSALGTDTETIYTREPDRVDVGDRTAWPLAFESGTWVGRSSKDGRPLIRGRYAAQWIKRGGRWLIRSEVFVALGCAGDGCRRSVID